MKVVSRYLSSRSLTLDSLARALFEIIWASLSATKGACSLRRTSSSYLLFSSSTLLFSSSIFLASSVSARRCSFTFPESHPDCFQVQQITFVQESYKPELTPESSKVSGESEIKELAGCLAR